MAARTAEAALQFFRDGLRDKRATTVEQWEEEFIREWSEVTSRLAPVVEGCLLRNGERIPTRAWIGCFRVAQDKVSAKRYSSFPSSAFEFPGLPTVTDRKGHYRSGQTTARQPN